MTDPAKPAPPARSVTFNDTTRLRLHPLSMRPEGESWVVGRMDTGDFIMAPPTGHRAITLLSDGHTIGEVRQALAQETGSDIAVGEFVQTLDDLGFVAAVDGKPCPGPYVDRGSLPWLRPHHVRWLLRPSVPWLLCGLIMAAVAAMIADPALVPSYHDLVWGHHSGIVLATNAALGWTLVAMHELGHLTTARAAGAPARMSLSTRLQFLAWQTDVSGVWAAPRRTRLTVYLAGMAVNLVVASSCVLVLSLATIEGLAHALLAAAVLQALLFLPMQFLIFMRTDVYFVVQDVTGCANLYADGAAHIRYLARRTWKAIRRVDNPITNPIHALPHNERRAVHTYSWVLLVGTIICLTVAATVAVPTTVTLLAQAITELGSRSALGVVDGAAALVAIVGFQLVWLRTWWRRHGDRVLAYLRTRRIHIREGR